MDDDICSERANHSFNSRSNSVLVLLGGHA